MDYLPADFAAQFSSGKILSFEGITCFWGQWIGRETATGIATHSVSYNEEQALLQIILKDEKMIIITRSGNISVRKVGPEIKNADCIRFEWKETAGGKRRILFYEFVRKGTKIPGTSNIHWSSISQSDLSVENLHFFSNKYAAKLTLPAPTTCRMT